MASDDTHRVVRALEDAGSPLGREELAARTGLDDAALRAALAQLRGQQVVRAEGDAFRLTYWPSGEHCVVCGEAITDRQFYELRLEPRCSTTETTRTGPLHPRCADALLDQYRLGDAA